MNILKIVTIKESFLCGSIEPWTCVQDLLIQNLKSKCPKDFFCFTDKSVVLIHWKQDPFWMHIRCSENAQDILRKSCVRLIHALYPGEITTL